MAALPLGLLLGAAYALLAAGLTTGWRTSRILNLAHGGFALAASYITYLLARRAALNPYVALIVAVLASFAAGWLLHLALDRMRGQPVRACLLTFGAQLIAVQLAQQLLSPGPRSLAAISRPSNEAGAQALIGAAVALALVAAVTLIDWRLQPKLTHFAPPARTLASAIAGGVAATAAGAAGSLLILNLQVTPGSAWFYTLLAFAACIAARRRLLPSAVIAFGFGLAEGFLSPTAAAAWALPALAAIVLLGGWLTVPKKLDSLPASA